MKILASIFFLFSTLTFAFDITPYDVDNNGELTLDDLRVLEESQLEELFALGGAGVIPGEDAAFGERIEYQGLPLARPADDAANMPWELIWGGKTFYRASNGKLKLDNKLLPALKEFLGFDIDLVRAEVTPDASIEDGGAVILIDYGNAEIPLFRPVRDEIRLVSEENGLYIGRASVYIPHKFFFFRYVRSVVLISLVNRLLDNGYNCKADNGGQYPQGDYCFGLWFALERK